MRKNYRLNKQGSTNWNVNDNSTVWRFLIDLMENFERSLL